MLTLTWSTDILFEKLKPETGINLKNTFCTMSLRDGWDFIHAKPVFFFNIFSVDPHADSLIIGLYLTCLITGQTFGEGTV